MSKLHLFLVTYLVLHSLALPVFGSFRQCIFLYFIEVYMCYILECSVLVACHFNI